MPPGTRQRLLDATFSVLEEKGLHGCRVIDVARRAGVAPASIYIHFENKAALISEALTAKGTSDGPLLSEVGDGPGAATTLWELGVRLLSGSGSALDRALLQLWATSLSTDQDKQRVAADLEAIRTDVVAAYRLLLDEYAPQSRRAPGNGRRRAGRSPADRLSAEALGTFGVVLFLGTTVAKALELQLLSPREAELMVASLGAIALGSGTGAAAIAGGFPASRTKRPSRANRSSGAARDGRR